ncbi:glutathione S-transferase family protein, partial [Pseudomonas aeruginosa]
LEEYADSRLGQVIIWQLFHQLVINRGIWQREPDQAILQRTYDEDLPSICNYLEGRVPPSGWLCGELSIADVAVACLFRNAQLARYQVDGERWPRLARLLADAFALPAFQHLARFEKATAQTPVAEQRQALREAGAPLSATSHARERPVRGPMSR